jgi:translation initiation factor 2B subunit (eIF-2B alpha/beta/delta family)
MGAMGGNRCHDGRHPFVVCLRLFCWLLSLVDEPVESEVRDEDRQKRALWRAITSIFVKSTPRDYISVVICESQKRNMLIDSRK